MSSRIVAYEGKSPLLTIRLKRKVPGGGTAPYKLDQATEIEFYVKTDPDLADANAEFVYKLTDMDITITDDGSEVTDKYSEITIQCAAADLTPPGVYYYHLDTTIAAKKDTVMSGFFEILNI